MATRRTTDRHRCGAVLGRHGAPVTVEFAPQAVGCTDGALAIAGPRVTRRLPRTVRKAHPFVQAPFLREVGGSVLGLRHRRRPRRPEAPLPRSGPLRGRRAPQRRGARRPAASTCRKENVPSDDVLDQPRSPSPGPPATQSPQRQANPQLRPRVQTPYHQTQRLPPARQPPRPFPNEPHGGGDRIIARRDAPQPRPAERPEPKEVRNQNLVTPGSELRFRTDPTLGSGLPTGPS